MNGTSIGTSNQEQGNHRNFSKLMGATEMKITTQIERAKQGLTNGMKNNIPAKFLGALVVAAVLVAVAATGFTPGQVQASEGRVSIQMELEEEWFNPVTGEPNGQLPNQVIQRSQGVLASPLSIERGTSWGLSEENFHPVTGESIATAPARVEISSFDLGEENYHPITGENISAPAATVEVSSFNLGEEYFHPVTGQLEGEIWGKIGIGSNGLGEEYYHPVSGKLDTNTAGMTVSSFGMAEENFHLITGELG